ncbi:MAG: DMT family transporter [Cyanobacteria bacterium J06627_32]
MGDVSRWGMPFIGEGAALLAAFLWAAATLMFGKLGRQLSPLVLNWAKGIVAIALISLTLLLQTRLFQAGASQPALPVLSVVYLLISGGLGIGLGDTAYFSAINMLGARRALLLETLAPPMTAVLAWIFLAEQLSSVAMLGIFLTLGGIAWVTGERVPGGEPPKMGLGIVVSLLATFCQAAGAVLSRAALAETAVSPLWSSLIRLFAGLAFMTCLVCLRPQYLEPMGSTESAPGAYRLWRESLGRVWVTLKSPRLLAGVVIAAFFATYLGIWLQQISLKYTAAGIAQALLATSPLFILPMAALLGERISQRAIWGVAAALAGVWLLLLSK